MVAQVVSPTLNYQSPLLGQLLVGAPVSNAEHLSCNITEIIVIMKSDYIFIFINVSECIIDINGETNKVANILICSLNVII